MKLHANARLSPNGRRLLIDRREQHGWDIRQAAEAASRQQEKIDARAAAEQSFGGGVLTDPAMVQVIGTVPMSTLANFGMPGFTHDRLDQLVAALTGRDGPAEGRPG